MILKVFVDLVKQLLEAILVESGLHLELFEWLRLVGLAPLVDVELGKQLVEVEFKAGRTLLLQSLSPLEYVDSALLGGWCVRTPPRALVLTVDFVGLRDHSHRLLIEGASAQGIDGGVPLQLPLLEGPIDRDT